MDCFLGCVGPPSPTIISWLQDGCYIPRYYFTFQMGELEKTSAFIEKANVLKPEVLARYINTLQFG